MVSDGTKIVIAVVAILVILNFGDIDLQSLLGNVRPTVQDVDPDTKLKHLVWQPFVGGSINSGDRITTTVSANAQLQTECGVDPSNFLRPDGSYSSAKRNEVCTAWCGSQGWDGWNNVDARCFTRQGFFSSGVISPTSKVTATATTVVNGTTYPFSYSVDLSDATFQNGELSFGIPPCSPFPQKVTYTVDIWFSDAGSYEIEDFAEAQCNVPDQTAEAFGQRLTEALTLQPNYTEGDEVVFVVPTIERDEPVQQSTATTEQQEQPATTGQDITNNINDKDIILIVVGIILLLLVLRG